VTPTEKTYYSLSGLYQLSSWFMAPVYPLFLLSRGLDVLEASSVLAIYLVTIFLFEVPTGAIADVFGRRVSFLASCAIRFVAFLLYSQAEGFADCVFAEILDGFGTTLASGALDAWAVDGVKSEGDERPVDRLFARAQSLTRASMIAGGVLCGYIATYSFEVAWQVAGCGFLVCAVIAIRRMDEPPIVTAPDKPPPTLTTTVRDGFATLADSPDLRFLCIASFVLVFAILPAHMTWQSRLEELAGESHALMGWVWAGVNLFAIVGTTLLGWLLPILGRRGVLIAGCFWRGATFAVTAAATSLPLAAGGWLLQEIGFGLTEPVFQSWTSDQASSEKRATVLSVRQMFVTLGGSAGLLVLGWVAREHGIPSAWALSAAILIALGAVLALSARGSKASGGSATGLTPLPPASIPPAIPEVGDAPRVA